MTADWTRTVAPVLEPVSPAEIKLHARITSDAEKALLASYLQTAREAAEDYLNRGLLTQTWVLTLDRFAASIWLPMASPLQSVTTVKYYDADGTLQTLASSVYDVDTVARPGRIVLAASQSWPQVYAPRRLGRVEITYVVGWTAAAAVPERIKQGIRAYATALFADRGDGVEDSSRAITAARACWDDRVTWLEPCGEY